MSFSLKICQDKRCRLLHVSPQMHNERGFSISCALAMPPLDSFIGIIIPPNVEMENKTLWENVINMPVDKVVYTTIWGSPRLLIARMCLNT